MTTTNLDHDDTRSNQALDHGSGGALSVWGPRVARGLLGLEFFVFGLNGFFDFMPKPASTPAPAAAFAGALFATGYMFPLLKGTEVLAGALLLSNRYVPLALALLAPVVVNIVAFHAALAPSGLPITLVTLALELYLAWSYRASFAPMLAARATTAAAGAGAAVLPSGGRLDPHHASGQGA